MFEVKIAVDDPQPSRLWRYSGHPQKSCVLKKVRYSSWKQNWFWIGCSSKQLTGRTAGLTKASDLFCVERTDFSGREMIFLGGLLIRAWTPVIESPERDEKSSLHDRLAGFTSYLALRTLIGFPLLTLSFKGTFSISCITNGLIFNYVMKISDIQTRNL